MLNCRSDELKYLLVGRSVGRSVYDGLSAAFKSVLDLKWQSVGLKD